MRSLTGKPIVLVGILLMGILAILICFVAVGILMILTRPDQRNIAYDVSPQGDQIVFTANGKGGRDIYRMHLDTRQVERVTNTPDYEDYPAYSPDGKQIVFSASAQPGETAHIYICALNGTGRRQLTDNNAVYDAMPAFSSDGSRIVFARAARHRPYSMGGWTWDDWDLIIINMDGTHARQITHAKYYQASSPQFSLNEKSVVFNADHHLSGALATDVFQVDSAGRQAPVLLTHDGFSSDPAVSRDGTEIVFLSRRGNPGASPFEYELWRMRADGTNAVQVTHNHSYNQEPRFLQDGKQLLFLSDPRRQQRFDLWQVDSNGSNLRRIADSSLFDDPLRWKP